MGRAFEFRKGRKMKRWGMMSRVFPKLAKAITMAAKEGGGDPHMNSALRTAIQNAKAQNMPKDNIDSAIKRATSKDVEAYIEMNYEGKGPHGVLVFVECATDNQNRTVANVKSYFNKAGGAVVPNGSLEFMFNRKSVFEFLKTDDMDLEELEFEFIDAGLEEIEEYPTEEDEDQMMVAIYGDYTNFGQLQKALEEKGIEIKSASLKRFPTTPVEFTEEQMEEIEKLIDKIDEDDDVQAVYTNIAE
ncbi:YebC/PmpR family DNA-binding regulatory protein [Roseivirga ehrenbergii]|uniref:Probable transcriptional regulatory protein MB14_07015 n=1 Tax=Roseivirga ehrenbergii (strain DSM 102268 / JCM 13514 / KCTC 12282 / NCIMB 14502 / KMM 6017) TaxID=279360 RepID=A0A150X890_ROSEK|nr:YebC/PmpR family DNA-binding transcriptional regulator [Roseivirga ehrenbergii]KYG74945.1 transcriptional regulator [Roseivirga ehrenbergii]TCL13711.1 YebC/PmpR family DNA-binding regulatory protein [Roseivirga ehrenbergii]